MLRMLLGSCLHILLRNNCLLLFVFFQTLFKIFVYFIQSSVHLKITLVENLC